MPKKILIIEDDLFLGDVLVQKFKGESFEVTLCRDGAEGMNKIIELKPDLILLDIILPSKNGYEILEEKKKDKSISNIPVIIISNSGQPVEISRILSLGAVDYLVKAQFEPEEVVAKVKAQLMNIEKVQGAANQESGGKTFSLVGKKIMWVEDDKFLSDIIARKLLNEKCLLLNASEGEEALATIAKEKPDLILLDILLSGINGFEILSRLKSDDSTKAIPVILLSNLGQKPDIDKGMRLGAARFLIKATVTLDEIIDEIKEVLVTVKA